MGRLARMFAPKTEELELLGGEDRVRVTSVPAVALLALTNLEWGIAAGLGIFGMAYVADRQRRYWKVATLNLCGTIPLCLIAISKPRYSFPCEPFFIILALYFLKDFPASFRDAWARHRSIVVAGCLALSWAWVAWGIFALTSRFHG